jgi:hypothetical protein
MIGLAEAKQSDQPDAKWSGLEEALGYDMALIQVHDLANAQ